MSRPGRSGWGWAVCAWIVSALLATHAPLAADSMTGLLEVLIEEDFDSGSARRIYFLVDEATGQRHELYLDNTDLPPLLTGSRVIVQDSGQDGGVDLRVLDDAPVASGPRASLTMIVDFQGAAVACSDDAVADLMFTGAQSIDGLYRESSFDAVSFPPDTDGNGDPDVLRVSIDASVAGECDPYGWAAAADAAAESAGVHLSLYQHRLYVLPSNTECFWAGLGNVGCAGSCRAWIAKCNLPDLYAHELGHNVGMGHSSTDTNADGILECEYCDRSDFMGYGGVGWRQVNGPHKMQMGWTPAEPPIDPVVGSQTYTITALETDPAQAPSPQILRIGGYYLSYLAAVGYNQDLRTEYRNRTSIHTYPGSGSANTLSVAALGDGETFQDTGLELTIEQLAHDADSATVRITVGSTVAPPVPLGLRVF